MEIPEGYHGVWIGMLDDDGRAEGYSCTVELNASGGTTRYEQAAGRGEGRLHVTGMPLVLREDYVGPKGGRVTWTLTVALNAPDELACHWRREGNRQQARATLHRRAASQIY